MDERLRWMRAIAERCAALVGPTDHRALLYDERGLPRN